MKKLSLGFIFPLVVLTLLIILFSNQIGQIPSVGQFLNPYRGFVQNEKENRGDQKMNFDVAHTEIIFDERSVPHIFTENDEDLYFAQGFVTASDRLWQMDFLSYVSAGRLSEIFGIEYLTYDRWQRRIGMLSSAQSSLALMEEDSTMKMVLDNYSKGVNQYIATLDKASLPFEYKFLGYKPEKWTNLKSVLIIKYMAATLSGYEEDVHATHMLAALGQRDYRKLFPDYKMESDSLNFSQWTLPLLLNDSILVGEHVDYDFIKSASRLTESEYNPKHGSNSWVISPEKSESGNAILSNDPHLDLTVPAIWYEIQLSSNEMNTYGYSIPGAPGVIIGFNENISWGITNGATDSKDWYKLDLAEDYSSYKMDGVWKKTNYIVEEITIKDNESYFDTIYRTEHGPIAVDNTVDGGKEIKNFAMSWQMHKPSNEYLAIYGLNHASNYDEFKDAIAHFKNPIQNFMYADNKGNIAMHHQGNINKRSEVGQGRFILEGNTSASIPTEMIKDLPYEFNPDKGYSFSANNNPFDWGENYVNGYYSTLRANKINELLAMSDKMNIDDMKSMQLDNTNRFAELAVPILIDFLKDNESQFIDQLNDWDYQYTKEATLASFFTEWWELIRFYTWDELIKYDFFLYYPDDIILLDLIRKTPEDSFFNRISTDKQETAKDIILLSFEEVADKYKRAPPSEWGELNTIQMEHFTRIEALGKSDVASGGHPNALNALSKNWGPSLRMIVEMGEHPQAYGIYAGGQSGNPGSQGYDEFVDTWLKGEYFELNLYKSAQEAKEDAVYSWIFN
ncbi:MAG: hypothetical protein GQ574_00245 [Crocinitomix sp.]|nr:hypothetical protein [Crocinitomix sp.]